MASPGQAIQIANAANRSDQRTKSATKCGQIYGGPPSRIACADDRSKGSHNQLVLHNIFWKIKATLRCAGASYKFDLNSDVASQGDRISGNWNEAGRNIFGNLQGTAGGGKIDVLVEAPGFTANLMLQTNGGRQTVQISSRGDIRAVSITMVRS
jgi:hypothetical protein